MKLSHKPTARPPHADGEHGNPRLGGRRAPSTFRKAGEERGLGSGPCREHGGPRREHGVPDGEGSFRLWAPSCQGTRAVSVCEVSHRCTPLLSLSRASSSEEPTSCGDADPHPRGPSWNAENGSMLTSRCTRASRAHAGQGVDRVGHTFGRELTTDSHEARQGPRARCLNTVQRAAVAKGHRASSCTAGPDVCVPGPRQTRHAESSDRHSRRKESKNRVRGSTRSGGPSSTKWEQWQVERESPATAKAKSQEHAVARLACSVFI